MGRFWNTLCLAARPRGLVGWSAVLLAAGLFCATGVSVFHTPPHEVMYTAHWLMGPELHGSRLAIATIEVGNTGRKALAETRVVLAKAVVDRAIMPMKVRDFGVSDRTATEATEGGRLVLGLGRLKPGDRVEVQFVLNGDVSETPPAWPEVLLAVEPAEGKAVEGHPDSTVFARFLFSVFGDLLPF
ncbi:MAG: hypothetical protein A3K19_19145 [Lentisphaerae bacterium RIFOXYB12_FULL_65_16]|nr:MAG: hypothetical protein A3K18_06165 [Lentisphaerae bacterium RIFOXYA12_64_32]OGV91572.1 MAG: hypothetical protein A3K19_19145 [Lentisphaerae bacterium RIFOXYB12_FULL_65_16]